MSIKIKAGFIGEQQRLWLFFSIEKKSDVKTPEQKSLALEIYLERLRFRVMRRILNISYGTVYQWVKKWEELVELQKK